MVAAPGRPWVTCRRWIRTVICILISKSWTICKRSRMWTLIRNWQCLCSAMPSPQPARCRRYKPGATKKIRDLN